MVVKKLFIYIILCISLASCYDKAVGPKLQNGYLKEIEVDVLFQDGSTSEAVWPSCRTVFLGHPEKEIERIIIRLDGEVIHKFDENDVREFLDNESSRVEVWTIDQMGCHSGRGKRVRIMHKRDVQLEV